MEKRGCGRPDKNNCDPNADWHDDTENSRSRFGVHQPSPPIGVQSAAKLLFRQLESSSFGR